MSSLQRRFVQIFALDPFYGEEFYNTIVCGSKLEKSNAYYEFPSFSVTWYFCFHFIWSLYWLYFDSS